MIVLEDDGDADHPLFEEFEFVFKTGVLLLSEEDVRSLLPEDIAANSRLVRSILAMTGGIPALVAAALNDIEKSTLGHSRLLTIPSFDRIEGVELRRVAQGWAERNLEKVMRDDLASIHAWISPLSPWSIPIHESAMTEVIASVRGNTVTSQDLARVRGAGSLVSSGREGAFVFPPVLAEALTRIARKKFPQESRELRRALVLAVSDEKVNITALSRIVLLTVLGAWDTLNRTLASSMMVLTVLTREQRSNLLKVWPEKILPEWGYLSSAKEFLRGEWRKYSQELPLLWRELFHLAAASDHLSFPKEIQILYERSLSAVSFVHKLDKERVCEELFRIRDYVLNVSRQVTLDGYGNSSSRKRHDEAIVLVGILLGLADSFLSVGELTEAQNCVNFAGSMCEACEISVLCAPALKLALTSRTAMFTAKAGMKEHARDTIAAYEGFETLLGQSDDESDQLVRIARRFLESDPKNLEDERNVPVDFNTQFSPVEVEAEAYILLLTRGPMSSAQYVQGFLGRTGWSALQPWEWWPLYAFLAMLDVREGRNARARSWLELDFIPKEITQIIEAGLALNEGREKESSELVEGVLSSPVLSDRWRLVACGLLLSTLREEVEVNAVLVSLQNQWVRNLAMVALMPSASRGLIVGKLPENLRNLPGLVKAEDSAISPISSQKQVRLTPRQYDVLRGLSEGKTLGFIAKELYLGVETIRSTAKALYRRLGVHDRHAAVILAQELRLL